MNNEQNSIKAKKDLLKMLGVRSRFFAQYWGVKCLYVGGVGLVKVGTGGWYLEHPDLFLELKPISSLSDEESIEYFDVLWGGSHKDHTKEFKISVGKDWSSSLTIERFGLMPSNVINGVDYLRSKGYAIPFMGYSINDLVSLGWFRFS